MGFLQVFCGMSQRGCGQKVGMINSVIPTETPQGGIPLWTGTSEPSKLLPFLTVSERPRYSFGTLLNLESELRGP